jgi:HK97 family phage portal protein
MGILSRIARLFKADLAYSDPKAWDRSLWNLIGSQSLSGENVTEETALTYSAVFCAVNLISGTIGSLPLHLMQKKGEKKRIADDRITYRLMHDEWNPLMSAMAGREVMMSHILLWGNGYAEKVRNGYGEVMELWPITPNRVRPKMQNGEMVYEIRMERDSPIILSRDKVLHVPGLGFDGYMGYSVIAMARKSIGLGMAMESFGSLYFGKGTHPSIIVSHPGQLSPPARNNIKESMAKANSGLEQSHRILLLEEGMKVEKWTISPEESQFLASRTFQIPEIARWFNLPPHKLKDMGRATWGNVESEGISFVTDSILPWVIRLEQAYGMQILTKSDKDLSGRGRLYFKHSLDGLLRADSAARGTFYKELFNIGVLSINDIRAFEDLDPIEGGDIHLIPMNMVPLEDAGKPKEVKPGALPQIPEDLPENGGGNGKNIRRSPDALSLGTCLTD